jgi:Fe2+ transport system protein FeoA
MSEEKKIKDLTGSLFPVTSLKEGEEGVIHSISGGPGFMSRLAGMGILPGSKIKILRNSRGPVIVLVNTTRVALGRGQASKILVVGSL